jgi:hypothetical protein
MSAKEKAKWEQFGDIQSMGKSTPQTWFSIKLLAKWTSLNLVRTVRHWEDCVEVSKSGIIREWNMGEIIATEKGLQLL